MWSIAYDLSQKYHADRLLSLLLVILILLYCSNLLHLHQSRHSPSASHFCCPCRLPSRREYVRIYLTLWNPSKRCSIHHNSYVVFNKILAILDIHVLWSLPILSALSRTRFLPFLLKVLELIRKPFSVSFHSYIRKKEAISHMRWPPEIIYAITISYLCEWVEMFAFIVFPPLWVWDNRRRPDSTYTVYLSLFSNEDCPSLEL